jgi:hypothetical protein
VAQPPTRRGERRDAHAGVKQPHPYAKEIVFSQDPTWRACLLLDGTSHGPHLEWRAADALAAFLVIGTTVGWWARADQTG